ncbi:MAG: hypothetical protein DDT21_02660 [Syntrophomonadaceae bacterium]|nr:hypothetical protein [Bacillota bacterium]
MAVIEVVESKLKLLAEYRRDLKEYEKIRLEEYRKDKKIQRFIERTLQLSIECCIDIASHITSDEGFREAKDNKDLFIILNEEKVISASLLKNLIKMAQFRNIIVHNYTRIEPEIVVSILRKNIVDFDNFAKEIAKFIF